LIGTLIKFFFASSIPLAIASVTSLSGLPLSPLF